MLSRIYGRSLYAKLEPDLGDDSASSPPKPNSARCWLQVVFAFILCGLSFGGGYIFGSRSEQLAKLSSTIPSLPAIGQSRQQVLTMPEMQAAPPADGSHEPAWDRLIPNGLGYIRHPTLAPQLSVIGVYHQLHCLYTVRRAYYAAYADSVGKEFNKSGVREPDHIGHCLDYLQQSLICNADIGIEPFYAGHYPDVMFKRQCRDYAEVFAWAEKWRVINATKFIFDSGP